MHKRSTIRGRGFRGAMLALLGAGSLLSPTCVSRVRDAIFQGTQDFAFSLLDPTAILDQLTPDSGMSAGG